jgi:hypothetical protein
MARYVARKVGRIRPIRSYWIDDSPLLPSLCADEAKTVQTGLLDARGNELIRLPNPCGFGRDEEWD